MAWNDTLIRRHAAVADLRLLSNGTTVETAIDSSLQQAQASEGHAHVRMYGHGWQSTSGRGCWLHCQAIINCDITPMDMLCARRCTRRTLQGVSHGWVDRHAVAASCQALPFPCCLDDGSRRHDTRATPKIVPILLIQHNRVRNQVTMTSDPTTPLETAQSLKRGACRRACAASETGLKTT